MISWEGLQTLDSSVLNFAIGRTPEVNKAYFAKKQEPGYMDSLVSMISTYLIHNNGYWIRDNDFPYDFKGIPIVHKVFWFNKPTSMSEAKCIVSRNTSISAEHLVICASSAPLKSVPDIDHYHVFISQH